jgi:hypothetical protein
MYCIRCKIQETEGENTLCSTCFEMLERVFNAQQAINAQKKANFAKVLNAVKRISTLQRPPNLGKLKIQDPDIPDVDPPKSKTK